MSDTAKPQKDEHPISPSTEIRKLREGSLVEGPRVQISYLYGVFGDVDGLPDEEKTAALRQKLMARIRLVITETGGKFEDLGRGRWSATLGATEPTEEDPLMAVTIGLKLLRLAAITKQSPPLRMVTVTGRISRRDLSLVPTIDPENATLTGGHELLRLARKIIRECEPGMLCADGLTYQMIRNTHFCHKLTELPGALVNVPIYEVRSPASSTNVTYEPPLCGREQELSHLKKVFTRVQRGDGPAFVTITGDLGIGKSRLARAFVKEVEPHCLIFRNPRERRRIDRWRRIPYSYFGEILRSVFDILENEDVLNAREKLQLGMEITIPTDAKPELPKDTARYLGTLCQIPFPEDPSLEGLEPAQLESRAFAALSQYLEMASRRKPIVFVLEDLYSADTSSLRLLQHFTEFLEPARILFLCVSRLDLLTELEQEANLNLPGERMILKPLSPEAARKMIVQLLPEDLAIPESLCEYILRVADGNPFFLNESLRDLAEHGLIEALQQGKVDEIEIPQNIEGILQTRLSRLTTQERDILQKASLFGKTFWKGGVEMLYRQEADIRKGWRLEDGSFTDRDDDLDQILESLVHKGILQYQNNSDFEGEVQYNFVPSLLHEIVYNEMSEELRTPYHLLIGQWLELMVSRCSSDINLEIAHHFDLGNAHTIAAPYHVEIGIRAIKVYATERAIPHLEQGLQHLDPILIGKRVDALRQLAEAYIINGQYKESIQQWIELLDLSWKMGQRMLAGEIYIRMGWVYFLMRDFKNALHAMKNGHTLHQETMQQRGIATALSNMGQVYMIMGDYQRSRLFLQEALDMRRDQRHPSDLAWALNNMGNLLLEQGDIQGAKRHHEEALEIRKEIGNPHLIIRSMNNLALIHVIQGNYDAALADLLLSSNLAQKFGEKLGMAIVMVNIGELYLLRGELDLAEKYIKQAMQFADKIGDSWIKAEGYRLQGELHLEQQDPFAAIECCSQAYKIIMERGIHSALSQLYRLMGEVYASFSPEELEQQLQQTHHFPEISSSLIGNALACYEESIALAHRHGNLREEAKSRMVMGIYEVNRGNVARGRYQLERAQAAFEQLGMQRDFEEVTEMLREIDEFQSSSQQPDTTSSRASLRPSRSKMANVDKTMVFRIAFDEEQIGPPLDLNEPFSAPPTETAHVISAQLPLQAQNLPVQESDLPDSLGDMESPENMDETMSIGADLLQISSLDVDEPTAQFPKTPHSPTGRTHLTAEPPPPASSQPIALPSVLDPKTDTPSNQNLSESTHAKETTTEPPSGLPRTQVPKTHTLEVRSPVYSFSKPAATDDYSPGHTLTTQLAVSSHQDDNKELSLSLPSVFTEIPPEEKAGVQKNIPSSSTPAQPPPPSEVETDFTVSLDEDDMLLETVDVEDPHTSQSSAVTTAPKPQLARPELAPATTTTPSMPLHSSLPDTAPTVAVRAPRRSTPPPPPPKHPSQDEIPTRDLPSPKRSGASEPPPSPATQLASAPASPPTPHTTGQKLAPSSPVLPSEMDLFNVPTMIRKPSVYDSQVIIAQVAENDDISRQWFEEGRSDRVKQFWKRHSEQLQEVREDMVHEQVVEEIDKLTGLSESPEQAAQQTKKTPQEG